MLVVQSTFACTTESPGIVVLPSVSLVMGSRSGSLSGASGVVVSGGGGGDVGGGGGGEDKWLKLGSLPSPSTPALTTAGGGGGGGVVEVR